MKDIESMLSRHTPKPTRELTPAFTQNILVEIKQHPDGAPKQTPLKPLWYFLRSASGIAVMAILIAVGGVGAYAVSQTWDDTKGATITLSPTDPTIITLKLKQCKLPSFQMSYTSPSFGQTMTLNGPTKFKILQPDKMSAANVKATILAWCEQQSVLAFYHKTYPQWFPSGESTTYQPYFGKIVSVTNDSITVRFSWRDGFQTVTYPLQPATAIYKDEHKVSQHTLHPGDNATFMINKPEDFSAPGWWPTPPTANDSTLLSITQTQYDFTEYDLYKATNSRVFMPLDLYNEQKASTDALAFYRKTYPAWFDQNPSVYYHFQNGSIKTITDTSITITFPQAPPQGQRNAEITYPIDGSLTIYKNGNRIPLSRLKAGDKALFVILTPSTVHRLPAGPSPDGSSLLSITKL